MILLNPSELKFPLESIDMQKVNQWSRGAISVEYALCMLVAVTLMMGVEWMFRTMSIEIMDRFIDMVSQFPDI
ncbi:MAG: hypothetical protein Q7U02_03935 [Desulfosalsimonadaceae bacterium]|nr:hypothetical protein [Desulfosalsimonadaceae bacterium]